MTLRIDSNRAIEPPDGPARHRGPQRPRGKVAAAVKAKLIAARCKASGSPDPEPADPRTTSRSAA
ncbi:MAG: hypothetical protein U1G05_14360 [Kiritimatiellia bacterium]